MSRHRAEVAQPRFFVGDPASLRGLPSLPDWCAALYLPRANFSECVRSSGLTLPNAYFLTPPERDIAVILPCATMRYHRDVAERRSDDVALQRWRPCVSARTPFTSRLLRRSAEVYLPHADLSSCVRSAEINPAQAAPRAARQRIPSRCVRCRGHCRVQGHPPIWRELKGLPGVLEEQIGP